MQNAQSASASQLPPVGPGMILSYIPVSPSFPLHFRLDGLRDDKPIDVFHTHNVLEIGLCFEGSGIFHVAGKVLPFHAGDVSVITPLEWHRSQSTRGSVSTWAWFFLDAARLLVPALTRKLPYFPENYAGRAFANILRGDTHPEITVLLRELVREAHARATGYEDSMRALVLVLLSRLHQRYGRKGDTKSDNDSETGSSSPLPATGPSRIMQALDAIARRYPEPLSVGELARLCHMSVRNFQLHFQRVVGQTPQSYLIQCRVQAAIAMLRTSDLSVTDLAFECGFGSLSSFNRAFQAHTGRKPSTFRKAA